jgi:hypothetical protein
VTQVPDITVIFSLLSNGGIRLKKAELSSSGFTSRRLDLLLDVGDSSVDWDIF